MMICCFFYKDLGVVCNAEKTIISRHIGKNQNQKTIGAADKCSTEVLSRITCHNRKQIYTINDKDASNFSNDVHNFFTSGV